jgi:hypothetical protein
MQALTFGKLSDFTINTKGQTVMNTPKPWDHIACRSMHYGAWDSGTRTIYETPTPLWEEWVESGHPLLRFVSPTRWTAYPKAMPDTLPSNATAMGVDTDEDNQEFVWVTFADEDAAFAYAMNVH